MTNAEFREVLEMRAGGGGNVRFDINGATQLITLNFSRWGGSRRRTEEFNLSIVHRHLGSRRLVEGNEGD